MTDKQLTDKQQTFIDALFGEAEGNPRLAAELAGYSENTVYVVIKALKEEIIERATYLLAMNSPKAAMALVDGIDNPTLPGINAKMIAAQQVLDRIGIVKQDKLEVKSDNGIGLFILPAKREVQDAPAESL